MVELPCPAAGENAATITLELACIDTDGDGPLLLQEGEHLSFIVLCDHCQPGCVYGG